MILEGDILKDVFENIKKSLVHLEALEDTFANENNYASQNSLDYQVFHYNNQQLTAILGDLELSRELYCHKDRQMILADIIEYIFFGRGYYAIKTKNDKQKFIKALLRFVNILMSYETMTVSSETRTKFLQELSSKIPEVGDEISFEDLLKWDESVGLAKGRTKASEILNKYFDTMLPKTAGGLWHELLVYSFLLKCDVGNIIPLLLVQRLLGQNNHIVPPDFLIISYDRRIYGIEVGTKKEIQSGTFSLQTAIPTATIDTVNSRSSDRCPICNRWIPFCDYVIENYSKFEEHIDKKTFEVRCLKKCTIYSKEDIVNGNCPYTKYARKRAETLDYTHHDYADNRHYHYQCVLKAVSEEMKTKIISAEDSVALKTHHPYYTGIDDLTKRR